MMKQSFEKHGNYFGNLLIFSDNWFFILDMVELETSKTS